MPTTRRSRDVKASQAAVWAVVTDPERRPDWWPNVSRVEEATSETWTDVLLTERARKPVRADFTVVDRDAPNRIVWRQEVVDSPFERILSLAETEVSLAPSTSGTTVSISATRKLRGWALFGGSFVRRATARQLNEALEALDGAVEPA
jgi:carbon monoxide dehydrogenase subunit G